MEGKFKPLLRTALLYYITRAESRRHGHVIKRGCSYPQPSPSEKQVRVQNQSTTPEKQVNPEKWT